FDVQMGQAAYAGSKAAIAGMTLPIARDLARSLIRVVAIAPSTFETLMVATITDEVKDSVPKQVSPPSRQGMPPLNTQLAEAIIRNPMLNVETIRLDVAIRMGLR